MASRRILVLGLVFALVCPPSFARTETNPSLGVVTSATRARSNSTTASVGATLYDGDRLDTDDQGSLGLNSSNVQLGLIGNSTLLMRHTGSGLNPVLERGTLEFSTKNGGFEVQASDVQVRPQSAALTTGRITLKDCDLVVTSLREALVVNAGKETKIVEPGKSYRVRLNRTCPAYARRTPIAPGGSRFQLLMIAAIGTITTVTVVRTLISPDGP
jgi:hypothetical protein